MNKNETMLAGLAIVVALIVVWEVGSIGLLLLPLVFAEIGAMIWGKPRMSEGESQMKRLPISGLAFDPDDIESIVAAAIRGDESAKRELVIKAHPVLKSSAKKLCRQAPEAISPDDLENIVWLKLFTNALSTYEKRDFYGWLWGVTVKTFLDQLRTWYRKQQLDSPLDDRPNTAEVTNLLDLIDDSLQLVSWLGEIPPKGSRRV